MQYLKQDVRDRILNAAILEFKAHGFTEASIRNIADIAEMSLGNIYRYFTNKEALYFAVINPFMDKVRQSIESNFIIDSTSPSELSRSFVGFIMENSDELIIIRKGNSQHYHKIIDSIVDAMTVQVEKLIRRKVDNVDEIICNKNFYRIISASFLNALFEVLNENGTKEEMERDTKEILTFFFSTIEHRFQN